MEVRKGHGVLCQSVWTCSRYVVHVRTRQGVTVLCHLTLTYFVCLILRRNFKCLWTNIYTLTNTCYIGHYFIDCAWNVMAHAEITDFVFRRNGQVHLNRPGGGVSSVDCWQPRCAPSAVVMLDTPCSEVVWRVLATHTIRQFPPHFPSRAPPCVIAFQQNTTMKWQKM